MDVRILVTNGGPHSAEKWAITTASQLIQIGADSASVQAIEGRKLELKLIDILEGHHGDVQKHERGQIEEHGVARLCHDLDCECHDLDAKVAEIAAAAQGTIFEEHFSKPEVQQYVRGVLKQHFLTSMDIERSWHADANMHTEEAQTFRASRGA